MKIISIIVITLLIGFGAGFIAFNQGESGAMTAESGQKQQYTCGMHPEIITDEPGYCPLCGMKLTPKKSSGQLAEGSIAIDPTTRQNIGLVTAPVVEMELSRKIRAFGKLDYSEPMLKTINIKVTGWVENLYVDYEGEFVRAGAPLFELYSPELVAAQREYLVALKNQQKLSANGALMVAGGGQILDAARLRLTNWDISDNQIKNLGSGANPQRTLTFYSPFDGIVVAKNIDLGAHLNPGAVAYKIADISELWVIAYVYEQDMPYLNIGQKATVSIPSMPGHTYDAVVSYISPYLGKNQQIEIRLNLDNPDFKLRPGIYADIDIESSLPGNRMLIPDKAVINSGMKRIVYTANPDGSFKPNVITTGAYGSDGYVEVRSGLDKNDMVVTSGQFLLDSESRLNESLMFAGNHNHGSMKMDDDKTAAKDDMKEMSDHSDHGKDMEMEKGEAEDELSGIYTCPMEEHYHVLQFDEGKCSECGMDLVPVEETDNSEVYYCPMDVCQVVQDKKGRCPKCGMFMQKLEMPKAEGHEGHIHDSESLKMDEAETMDHSEHMHDANLTGIYTCPMKQHYNVLQYGESKCDECGMNLVPIEQTDNTEVYYCPMAECGTVQAVPGDCPVCGMNLAKLQSGDSDD